MEERDYRCVVPIEVRFRDLDAFAHVNNAVYFSYFEHGRVVYLREIGGGGAVGLDDLRIVLVDAACRYRSPALLGEVLQLGVRVGGMRRSSFTFEYRLRGPDGRLVAEGRTIQAAFDHSAGKVTPLDPAFRALVEGYEGRTFDPQVPVPPWGRA